MTTNQPRTCQCGCGAEVARSFKPGHDAKLKSRLLAETKSAVWQRRERAIEDMISRGWGHFIDTMILGMQPKRGFTSTGRRIASLNINGMVAWHVDETETSHAHRFCPEVKGATRMQPIIDGGAWACGACIHTTEHIDDVQRMRMHAWVMEAC